MTVDQAFTKYQGQSLLVPGDTEADRGQCVQWADYVLKDVYGLPYHFGNAIDWWNNPGELLNHFDKITDGSIKKGDFVIFNTKVGSQFGHIDVAGWDGTTNNYLGYDSNWGGNLTVHQVQHTGQAGWILGSLRLKGGDVLDQDLLKRMYNAWLGRDPKDGDLSWVGKKADDLAITLDGSEERKEFLAHQSGINKAAVVNYISEHLQ